MLGIGNIFLSSVPAQASFPSDDACDFSFLASDGARSAFESPPAYFKAAVADGAGTSVLPGAWARQLVRAFVAAPGVSMRMLQAEQAVYWTDVHIPAAVACSKSATYSERLFAQKLSRSGSHASFLGVDVAMRVAEGTLRLRVRSSGDCALFVFRAGEVALAHPFASIDEFPTVPQHVCSLPEAALRLDRSCATAGRLQPGDVVVLATDEVARWVLRTKTVSAHSDFLRAIQDNSAFATWVDTVRASDLEVRLDDMTVLRFEVNGG